MMSLALRLLPLLVILSAPSVASAGGVLFGLGAPMTRFDGDLPRYVENVPGMPVNGGRFGLGVRLGNWAVEATGMASDVRTVDGGYQTHVFGLGGDVRRFVPVTQRLELYGRVGVERAMVAGPVDMPQMAYRGFGVHGGAGAALSMSHQGGRLSLTLEVLRQQMWLSGAGDDIDGAATSCIVGVEVSVMGD